VQPNQRETVLRFIQTALRYFQLKYFFKKVPRNTIPHVEFEGETGFTVVTSLGIFGDLLCHQHRRKLQSFNTALLAADMLISQNFVQPIVIDCSDTPPPEAYTLECIERDLEPMLAEYITKYNTFKFDKQHASELLDKHLINWSLSNIAIDIFAPLCNFQADFDEFLLPNGCKISRFLPAEKNRIRTSIFDYEYSWGIWDLAKCQYKIHFSYTVRRDEGLRVPETIQDKIKNTITALRLTRKGSLKAIHAFAVVAPPVIRDGIGGFSLSLDTSGFPEDYRLTEPDKARLVSLVNLLDQFQNHSDMKRLLLAFQWLHKSYSRMDIQEIIISQVITLECTLLAHDSNELSYRLGTRGAALLRDSRDAVVTDAILRALYDARSKIVHEGATGEIVAKIARKTANMSLAEFTTNSEQIIRQILIEYLARLAPDISIKSINKELDAYVIQSIQKN